MNENPVVAPFSNTSHNSCLTNAGLGDSVKQGVRRAFNLSYRTPVLRVTGNGGLGIRR